MNVLFILMGLVTETIWAIGCSIYAASIGNIFTPPGESHRCELSKLPTTLFGQNAS